MIDWISMKISLPHQPISQGLVLKLDPEGQITKQVPMGNLVEGSHSSQVRVVSSGSLDDNTAQYLCISGNPSKFLQGHNVIGSDDLLSLAYDMFSAIQNALKLTVPDDVDRAVRAGDYTVSMVDINHMFDLGGHANVEAWLKAAEIHTRTRNGRPVNTAGTVYWNKHSRYWAIKAYNKLTEATKGKSKLPTEFLGTDLLVHATGKLRLELRLLQKELVTRSLTKAADLAIDIRSLFNEYMEKIVMPENYRIKSEIEHNLPGRLRSTYRLWIDGHDVSEVLTKATFYRHRKELQEYGIDISIKHDRTESNVIPLIRPLEAKPVPIPQWAIDQGLVHHSASNF